MPKKPPASQPPADEPKKRAPRKKAPAKGKGEAQDATPKADKPKKPARAKRDPDAPKKTIKRPNPVPAVILEDPMKRMTRPPVYRPEYVEIARRLCAVMGATDQELADFIGVSEATINNWKRQYPEFGETLRTGKTEADSQVADRLYKKAVGYQFEDTDIRTITLEGPNAGSQVVLTPITRTVQPDTQAITWWMKNRRPNDWKDKTEVTVEQFDMDLETAEARFASRMRAAAKREQEMRERRQQQGMNGD